MNPYVNPPTSDTLDQGDIISDCPLHTFAPPEDDPQGPVAPRVFREQVFVLTQACDLAQAKTDRVVVAPVIAVEFIIARQILKPAAVRDHVRLGRMFGWYFLPAAEQPIGLSESVVDLRQLYTVRRDQLNQLIATGHRVCRLITPFREHLAQHFAVTYMRIALPQPYDTQP